MFSFFRPISASSISLSKKRPTNSHASGPSYAPIAISISGFLVFTQTAPSWKRKDLLASWNSSRSLSVSLCLCRGLGMLGDFYHFHCSFAQHIYLIIYLLYRKKAYSDVYVVYIFFRQNIFMFNIKEILFD